MSSSSSSQLACSLSWPPRSYSCSFCKREFRSAQALGGHMNVHRRDKARLRESPPHPGPPVLNFPNPNPNSTNGSCSNIPNLNMPPPSTSVADGDAIPVTYPFPSTEPPPLAPLCSSSTASKGLPRTAQSVELEEEGISIGDLRKNKLVVNLNLDIGLFGTDHGDGPDLELRLGCRKLANC